MKKLTWLATALLLSCVACTAKEEKKTEHKNKSVKEHKDNSIEEDFRRLDANHDGSISKDEIEKIGTPALQLNFDNFDANKDGKLSLQETTAFVLAQREETARRKNEVFGSIDANHDGGVSKEEAEKVDDLFFIGNFREIDASKDGKLSMQELDAFAEAQDNQPDQNALCAKPEEAGQRGHLFIQTDKDHNGTLSRDELKGMPEYYRDFDKVDTDHDGKITPLEIDSYARVHASPAQGQTKVEIPTR